MADRESGAASAGFKIPMRLKQRLSELPSGLNPEEYWQANMMQVFASSIIYYESLILVYLLLPTEYG